MKSYFIHILFFTLFVGSYSYAQKLEIYTNDDKEEYLGCLNCDAKDSKSIWNNMGAYGNLYNKKSIWNKYGVYGDNTSNLSPWNPHAEKPPIIKKDGKKYGYFTLNKFVGQRVEISLTKMLYDYYMDIREDVTKWSKNASEITTNEAALKLANEATKRSTNDDIKKKIQSTSKQ
ncbi:MULTISPECIES: hypothetical protein [Myroides]|uniref:hypothetical protein n=1 Tax=Myroides TaxID=76831 RepID=UPI001E3CC4CC|nr:hypothetical protein [Myroides phaeus]